jgi:hypothetical protein
MPDAPLLVGEQTWRRIEKVFAALLQARHAERQIGGRVSKYAAPGCKSNAGRTAPG